MKFLALLMVIMLLAQELPFILSHVQKDQSGNGQLKSKTKSAFSVWDTKNKEMRSNKTNSENNKTVHWGPLSDEEAKAIVTKKGVLKNPAVSLVTVSGDLLKALKTKGTASFSPLPEQRKKIPNSQQDLCEEEEVSNYTLLKPNGNLAYRIQGAKCSKNKNGMTQKCSFHKISFGECVETKSTVVLSVFNARGGPFDKTIKFNSSCKCRKYKST